MSIVKLKGATAHTSGELPKVGTKAPDFKVVNSFLEEVALSNFKGNRIVLNIFPSVDTGVCATSVREFNKRVANMKNTKVLCISKDLPFALSRFCSAEGLENVVALSDFRGDFSSKYKVEMSDTPMRGLFSRCVVVLDQELNVIYTEQVPEIGQEPNYQEVEKILR